MATDTNSIIYHSARVSPMIVIYSTYIYIYIYIYAILKVWWRVYNVQICALPALLVLDNTIFPSSLFACSVGLWERHIQITSGYSNATFNLSKWLLLTTVVCIRRISSSGSYLKLINSKFMKRLCYVLDWSWSLLRACGIYFPLLSFYGDCAKVSLPFHVHYFMCIT